MRRKFFHIYMLLSMLAYATACIDTGIVEPVVPDSEWLSEMQPSVVFENQKPANATKALVDFSSSDSLKANFLRIDQDIDDAGDGLESYNKSWGTSKTRGKINWGDAYLLESSSISSPDMDGKRTVYLNPLQTYNTRKTGPDNDPEYTYYKTMMVSWYPQTCVLHKSSDGTTASMTDFKTYKMFVKNDAYTETDDGVFSIKFTGLNGEKDIMVSNAVEAMQWHNKPDGETSYRYPFGSSSEPPYDNPLTYRHYLSAVRLHAYAERSGQDAEIWGRILGVLIMDQPESCEVQLPSALCVETSQGSGLYTSVPGNATWSGNVDFPIVKTPMFGKDDDEYVVTEDMPSLADRTTTDKAAYLGYSLVKPGSELRVAIHTEAGIYELNLSAKELTEEGLKAGYVYDIYLNFQTAGNISALLLNDGIHKYYDLSSNKTYDISDTQVEHVETANCYIVHPDLYKDSNGASVNYDGFAFLANVAGNGDGGILSSFDRKTASLNPVKAGLVWESSPGLVYQVEYMYGYVRFRTDPPINANYKEGNAVIAVYDNSDNIIWSWHIWITDKPADKVLTKDGTSVIFLDRNLGATSATAGDGLATYGLYYQWGRKDPSMGPPTADFKPQSTTTSPYYDTYAHELSSAEVYSVTRPTVTDGVRHPMYLIMPVELSPYYQYDWLYEQKNNLWGYESTTGLVQKSIYDPCPAGYRVPAEELNWLVAGSTSSPNNGGLTYSGIFFPFSGYKGVDRGMSSMTCAWKYVGKKADYMSAKTLTSGHRARVYMSDVASWKEVGTEGQTEFQYGGGYVRSDGANRRVAGSVRCVKDIDLGTIQAAITTSRDVVIKGETIKLNIAASTPSSTDRRLNIKSVKLEYSTDNGENWNVCHTTDMEHDHSSLDVQKWNKSPEIKLNKTSADDPYGVIPYETESSSSTKTRVSITFRLTVTNGLGLSVEKRRTVTYYPLSMSVELNDGRDLLTADLKWYDNCAYTVKMNDLTGDAKYVEIEGTQYNLSDTENGIPVGSSILDSEFNIKFLNENKDIILERSYPMSYEAISIDTGNNLEADEFAQRTTAGTPVTYVVIKNRDDASRHIRVDADGKSYLSRDAVSAYGVFKVVDFEKKDHLPYDTNYKNVGSFKLMHLATGLYLYRNGETLALAENPSNDLAVFYFCSDWGSESVDNVDVVNQYYRSYGTYSGYYLDAPDYTNLILSTTSRAHYKWYIQEVTNGPAAN